jgi:hypothetical protein
VISQKWHQCDYALTAYLPSLERWIFFPLFPVDSREVRVFQRGLGSKISKIKLSRTFFILVLTNKGLFDTRVNY